MNVARVLALVIVSFVFLTTIILALRTKRPALIVIFGVLSFMFFLRPVLVLSNLDFLIPEYEYYNLPIGTMIRAVILYLLWGLIILGGMYFVFRNGYNTKKQDELMVSPRKVAAYIKILSITTVALILPGAIFTAFKLLQYGSIGQFMYSVKIEKELIGVTFYYVFMFFGTCLAGITMVFYRHHKKWFSLGVMTMIFCASLSFQFIWGIRYSIGLVAVAFLSLYISRRPSRNLFIGLFIAIFLLAGVNALRTFRDAAFYTISEGNSNIYNQQSDLARLSLSLHASEYDAFVLALRDANTLYHFRWGQDFLNSLLGLVPRSILPDRESFYVGAWFRRLYEPWTKNGWPVTSLGSWFVNFGYLGILFGALSTVLMLAFIERYASGFPSYLRGAISVFLVCMIMPQGFDTLTFRNGIIAFSILTTCSLIASSLSRPRLRVMIRTSG
jgi:oligosaccharide repeat unit polymerase